MLEVIDLLADGGNGLHVGYVDPRFRVVDRVRILRDVSISSLPRCHFTIMIIDGRDLSLECTLPALEQVRMRAQRIDVPLEAVLAYGETDVTKVVSACDKEGCQLLIIDSIQTMYVPSLPAAPGTVGQVREAALKCVELAKRS